MSHIITLHNTIARLSSLRYLTRPLALPAIGIVLLSLGIAYFEIALYQTAELPVIFYYLTFQFLSHWERGAALSIAGLLVLATGIWQLGDVAIFSLRTTPGGEDGIMLGYQRTTQQPRVTVISGGAGLLILAALGRSTSRLTCVTPVQDPVEYYMTEPGLTDGFSVAAHIRQIVRYGGFAPDYVLVNAQRIDPDVRRIYESAGQARCISSPRSTRRPSSARMIVWQRVM